MLKNYFLAIKGSIRLGILLWLLGFCAVLQAEISMPAYFADHMVVQRRSSLRVWGWGTPGEMVQVSVSRYFSDFLGDTIFEATTTGEGIWNAYVPTGKAGGPYKLTCKSKDNTLSFVDIMVGEVWICSGQSNMEWSHVNGVKDMAPELAAAPYKNIRLFSVSKSTSPYPQNNIRGSWSLSDSASLSRFSAVGYFFGKNLQTSLNVPIGLINASWGGTPIEVWIPELVMRSLQNLGYRTYAQKYPDHAYWPTRSGLAYNAMIAPLEDFPVAGVIWYQGESNTANPEAYRDMFAAMVRSWRKARNIDIPFYYVQIAPFTYGDTLVAAYVREQQDLASKISKVGMVVISDLVDNIRDIHPAYKAEVGKRLANFALRQTYAKSDSKPYKSPSFSHMELDKGKARLFFKDAPNGMMIKGETPTEFEIAGEDQKFVKAEAKIEGKNVLVWSEAVKAPVAVRFAFRSAPEPNLFSKEGLPLAPFRTDSW